MNFIHRFFIDLFIINFHVDSQLATVSSKGPLYCISLKGNSMPSKHLKKLIEIIKYSLKKVYYPVLFVPLLVGVVSFCVVALKMPAESYASKNPPGYPIEAIRWS